MNPIADRLKKLTEILAWSEMRILWIILPLLAAIFAVAYGFVSIGFRTIIAGLIFGAVITTAIAIYRAAKAMRESTIERNELKSILFGLEDAVVVYDRNFRVIFFNPAAEKLFKLGSRNMADKELRPQDVDEVELQLLIQVIFPSLAPGVVARTPAGEYPQIADVSFVDPNLELRVLTAPMSDEKGGLLGFMKVIRDRTRELGVIRSKTEFLTVASHQLRTPLTEVRWALESLAGEAGSSDTGKTILEGALTGTRSLLKIVEDLLNIARIEEGRFGYNFEETDIAEFISSALAEISPMARHAGVKVYFDQPKGALPRAVIDKEKFSLVLNNLLENAVRYNVENGQVVVRISELKNQPFLQISVEDTGIGIPEGGIEKLFTKFYRAENALKSQTEGSGLGLYIARNIIRAHGGKIWAESEVGRGTTIHFTLPTDPNLVPKHEAADLAGEN